MNRIPSYYDFLEQSYQECRNADWFPAVLEACHGLDTDELTVSALVGEIHEGLRVDFDEAIKYFWTILLINPLIAVKAYQETDLLLGKMDLFSVFKRINPIDTDRSWLGSDTNGIYNTSVECFLIFAMEALLQKDMNPELLDAINRNYLGNLYNHDKEIMTKKAQYEKEGVPPPPKWINHRNLRHILNAIDPHHIIVLLEFFADRYGARLKAGNVGRYCYSGDKYDYIIRFIKSKYGSLSEYILWDDINYAYHYRRYYERSLYYDEMYANMDVVFPTQEDKNRIQQMSGILISDRTYQNWRAVNRAKNPPHGDTKDRRNRK